MSDDVYGILRDVIADIAVIFADIEVNISAAALVNSLFFALGGVIDAVINAAALHIMHRADDIIQPIGRNVFGIIIEFHSAKNVQSTRIFRLALIHLFHIAVKNAVFHAKGRVKSGIAVVGHAERAKAFLNGGIGDLFDRVFSVREDRMGVKIGWDHKNRASSFLRDTDTSSSLLL